MPKSKPHFSNGKFRNIQHVNMLGEKRVQLPNEQNYSSGNVMWQFFMADKKLRTPQHHFPVHRLTSSQFQHSPSHTLRAWWLGHSSTLLELGGRRYLLDPVFCKRASFTQLAGPKRFHPSPVEIRDIPNVDAVILSHDHYDHMDYHTMKQLSKTNTLFYVPLGVKKILESWGCNPNNIKELNWWDEVKDGPNRLVATPARHFSGRSLFNRFETLWCSWSILGTDQSVFYCGDSGHMDGFQEIRNEIGTFDLTIMPIGAYHPAWRDIHTNAEEAHDAHITLGGKVMLPVHWGTFNLALHPWDEPIEHLLELSQKAKSTITTPQIGEEINFQNLQRSPWWRK